MIDFNTVLLVTCETKLIIPVFPAISTNCARVPPGVCPNISRTRPPRPHAEGSGLYGRRKTGELGVATAAGEPRHATARGVRQNIDQLAGIETRTDAAPPG